MSVSLPSTIFGDDAHYSLARPVHVLFLIENSLAMRDHWLDLRQRIVPSILGAVRLANPAGQVEIFWRTTGIRTTEQKSSSREPRQFDDFPDIEIINHPANKLTPQFIQQSIDLFLCDSRHQGVAINRHLIIAAVNSITEAPLIDPHALYPQHHDAHWDHIASKLLSAGIILHVITNPSANLAQIVDLYQNTIRVQGRMEVLPWKTENRTQCVCRLSGSRRTGGNQAAPPPALMDPNSYVPPLNRVHSHSTGDHPPRGHPCGFLQRNHSFPVATHSMTTMATRTPIAIDTSTRSQAASDTPIPSLVSRLQAIHNLTKRKADNNPPARAPFFRDTSPEGSGSNPSGHGTSGLMRRMSTSPPSLELPLLAADGGIAMRKKRRTTLADGRRVNNNRPLPSARSIGSPAGTTSSIIYFPSSELESDSSLPSSPTSLWTHDSVSATSGSPLHLPKVSFDSALSPFAQTTLPSSPSELIAPGLLPHSTLLATSDSKQADIQMPSTLSQPQYTPVESAGHASAFDMGATGTYVDPYVSWYNATPCDPPVSPIEPKGQAAARGDKIPTSIPPVDGHAPFLIDSEYEARCALRLKNAISQQSSSAMPTAQLLSYPAGSQYTNTFVAPTTAMRPSFQPYVPGLRDMQTGGEHEFRMPHHYQAPNLLAPSF